MPSSGRNPAKRLLKAEERYRGIFENSVAGIFQTTPEGTYLDVNPALTRIYGYSTARR
jgi:PAS domain S-box-containing protein